MEMHATRHEFTGYWPVLFNLRLKGLTEGIADDSARYEKYLIVELLGVAEKAELVQGFH